MGFGFRVQRSAFECILIKINYQKLVDGIPKYLAKEDLLRIYRLAGYADVKMWGQVGKRRLKKWLLYRIPPEIQIINYFKIKQEFKDYPYNQLIITMAAYICKFQVSY
jgi:hypothetical protein